MVFCSVKQSSLTITLMEFNLGYSETLKILNYQKKKDRPSKTILSTRSIIKTSVFFKQSAKGVRKPSQH